MRVRPMDGSEAGTVWAVRMADNRCLVYCPRRRSGSPSVSIGSKLAEASRPSFVFVQVPVETKGNARNVEHTTKEMLTMLCESFRYFGTAASASKAYTMPVLEEHPGAISLTIKELHERVDKLRSISADGRCLMFDPRRSRSPSVSIGSKLSEASKPKFMFRQSLDETKGVAKEEEKKKKNGSWIGCSCRQPVPVELMHKLLSAAASPAKVCHTLAQSTWFQNRWRLRQARPERHGLRLGIDRRCACARWAVVKQAPCGLFAWRITGCLVFDSRQSRSPSVCAGSKVAEASTPSFVFVQALDETKGTTCVVEHTTKKMLTMLPKFCGFFRDSDRCQQTPARLSWRNIPEVFSLPMKELHERVDKGSIHGCGQLVPRPQAESEPFGIHWQPACRGLKVKLHVRTGPSQNEGPRARIRAQHRGNTESTAQRLSILRNGFRCQQDLHHGCPGGEPRSILFPEEGPGPVRRPDLIHESDSHGRS
ncbi:hypothetical protein MRX96_031155 [Rhipicephalus microplus]